MECVWTTWLQGYDNLSEEALVDFVRLSIEKKKEKTCESKIRDLLATIYMSMLQQSIDKKKVVQRSKYDFQQVADMKSFKKLCGISPLSIKKCDSKIRGFTSPYL